MPTAHLWDDAKTAGMVAALRDLHIGAVRRGKAKARCVVVGDVGRTRGDEVERPLGNVERPTSNFELLEAIRRPLWPPLSFDVQRSAFDVRRF